MPCMTCAARRETEVIAGLFKGWTNVEIARHYCLALRTVKDIVWRLTVRYVGRDRANRVQLAVALHAAGLCPCEQCTTLHSSTRHQQPGPDRTVRQRPAANQARRVPTDAPLPQAVHLVESRAGQATMLEFLRQERSNGL